ncbi:MAG: CBS domain-containing protein [Wenzhouxiangellaceae bacterium]|nr:CBS domain-containing protein [Wenzhouxiangellaceae bacterium]
MSDAVAHLRVRDVMQTDFDTIDGMQSVADALKLMRVRSRTAVIVERKHGDDEYGMLLVSDIARLVIARDRNPARVNVYEIMAKPVLSVHPDMKINYCARLLQQFNITRAPVIDNRHVVGLVSFDDLVLKGLIEDPE